MSSDVDLQTVRFDETFTTQMTHVVLKWKWTKKFFTTHQRVPVLKKRVHFTGPSIGSRLYPVKRFKTNFYVSRYSSQHSNIIVNDVVAKEGIY